MAVPDSSLGIAASFDATQFNAAIRFAMQMGTPNDPDRQPKFVKKAAGRRYFLGLVEQFPAPNGTLRLDRDGRPFNPEVRIEQVQDEFVTVDCAVEVVKADADELPVGNFRATKAICTLLDEDYAKVVGCRELRYNADTYIFGYEPEANGLFDAGVHTMIFYALDES